MSGVASPSRMYFPISTDPGPGGYDVLTDPDGLAAFCLDVDTERAHYLELKRQIAAQPGRAPAQAPGAATEPPVRAAEQFVRARMLEHPAFRAQSELLCRQTFAELVFALQEDLVVMHRAAGHAPERARAVHMHVCFPGGWDPAQLLGKSFTALHARVPYERGFGRGERTEHAARLFQAPLARYVWSVCPEPTLDRHPDTPRQRDFHSATELFLRVERQIMVPLPEAEPELGTTSLFFIRTYVYGRDRLSAAQRGALTEAITNMSDAMRRYKGMFGYETSILRLLS